MMEAVVVQLETNSFSGSVPREGDAALVVAQSGDCVSFDHHSRLLEQVIEDLNDLVRIGVVDEGRSSELDT